MSAKLLPIGNGFILLTNEDFAVGYQAGHLAYMVARHGIPCTDEQLTELFLEQLESTERSSRYGMGFVVGWLATLATKDLKPSPAIRPTEERK